MEGREGSDLRSGSDAPAALAGQKEHGGKSPRADSPLRWQKGHAGQSQRPDLLHRAQSRRLPRRQRRNWIRRGELPSYKLGAARRIDPADVENFLSRHRDEAS